MTSARFIIGDTRAVVATLPDASVDLIMTSPPFLALRSYLPADHPDKHLEIGQEANPAAFIDMLLELTAEWGRVLAPHGSIAVELGDTYSGPQPAYRYTTKHQPDGRMGGSHRVVDDPEANPGNTVMGEHNIMGRTGPGWPLAKSLVLIPELYRIGLAYGINPLTGQESPAGRWRVRNTVRWCRPNPPVGALGDKYRPSTSDMVVATRSAKRWFDLDAVRNGNYDPQKDKDRPDYLREGTREQERVKIGLSSGAGWKGNNPAGAPPLDHWIIPTHPYKGAHYATFPPELCRIPIESMCPRQVCTTCGEPRRRIVEKSPEYAAARAAIGDFKSGRDRGSGLNGTTQYHDGQHIEAAQNVTLGWTDCGHNTWRNGIVLDPFGGSGTVGQVATGHGRDAILVDLDERNADLARERIGMFATTEHHNQGAA